MLTGIEQIDRRQPQTGLRVSELIGLDCGDVTLGAGAQVRCLGKGHNNRRFR